MKITTFFTLVFFSLSLRAAPYHHNNGLIHVPKNAQQIRKMSKHYFAKLNKGLNRIAQAPKNQLNFEQTFKQLDITFLDYADFIGILFLLSEAAETPKVKKEAAKELKAIQNWANTELLRTDVYAKLKTYAQKIAPSASLNSQQKRLIKEWMSFYKFKGMHLSKEKRDQVAKYLKKLSHLTEEASKNLAEANRQTLYFKKEELKGVPEKTFQKLESKKSGELGVPIYKTSVINELLRHCLKEKTRKKIFLARVSRALEQNAKLLDQMVVLRQKVAQTLGFAHWADYNTAQKMAKTGMRAFKYIKTFNKKIKKKYKTEVKLLTQIKRQETAHKKAKLNIWDLERYQYLYKKDKFKIDADEIKKYFELNRTIEGMVKVYEKVFSLKIETSMAKDTWTKDEIPLLKIKDATSKKTLGHVYLDLYPRPKTSKYNHFAQFGLINRRKHPDGPKYLPSTALVCNFPRPTKKEPSLLSFYMVETLFHEFGHALFMVLAQADFGSLTDNGVPQDFIEAPSQMLEYFLQQPEVINIFAKHYQDTKKSLPIHLIKNLQKSKDAFVGISYRRQLTFGLFDLDMYLNTPKSGKIDTRKRTAYFYEKNYLPGVPGLTNIGNFSHLWSTGYSAGYYGYAWADGYAADMASIFQAHPQGFLSEEVGMKLRKELFEVGHIRDIDVSVEKFLGRKFSLDSFFKKLGI